MSLQCVRTPGDKTGHFTQFRAYPERKVEKAAVDPVHAMKGSQRHSFLTSALDGGDRSNSSPGRYR
jgi:hypothetical protein